MDASRLLDALREGLPLTPRPFAAIGQACGASEDEVLEHLGRLYRDGRLARLAPQPPVAAAQAACPAADSFDERLLAILAGGIPLLPSPYEAIATALDAPEAEVLAHLRALVAAGTVGCIGTGGQPPAAPAG